MQFLSFPPFLVLTDAFYFYLMKKYYSLFSKQFTIFPNLQDVIA